MTAVREDEVIRVNPCRIPGADREASTERATLTVDQVFTLVECIPARYRALVLLATFASLRWGEVVALQRKDLDPASGSMAVRQAYVEVRAAGLVLGPPKSRAGIRTVSIPPFLRAPLRQHLIDVADDPEAFVFTTETGRPIWRCNFNKLVGWQAAVAGVGRPGLHFHDLRHTDNTLAADSGTGLRNYRRRHVRTFAGGVG